MFAKMLVPKVQQRQFEVELGSDRYSPFGIWYPWYISSEADSWTTPMGSGGLHRSTSRYMASIYGKEGRSSKLGRRCIPTTESISFCALF